MPKSQSGLGTVKRDWSSNSVVSQPTKSSQEIPWSQSPPRAPAKKLTGSEERLRAIQEALSGYPPTVPPPLAPSKADNKRTSPNEEHATAPVVKRARRILPNDWHANDALSKQTLSSSSNSFSNKPKENIKSSFHASASSLTSTEKKKLAAVFLSQEQTQILKLVQEGDSVFYTGSAVEGTGKSVLLREIIKTLRKKYNKTPDVVAITASTGPFISDSYLPIYRDG
ncbi:hypothetical protein CVT25_010309 [Psilocybe cyanescens]|uniref:ATP-dependent DNA helicase n=1 Tax=Psilocybe cyanescens TaxID=93625 RepID=A0A409VNN3_PSICY|nr:hypothetical protein CVT25_010309 [Psilocybe cyanescens]